jgi:aspartate kinase
MKEAMKDRAHISVVQGFIGGTADGMHTTLGREGSDYSAAVVGNVLGAESVTIWKDVPGILTADPRINPKAKLIEELDYSDAARLAASGAQIIHSKTIQPLEEKNIPLYVRPFLCPWEKGSVVRRTDKRLDMPVEWGK